MKINPEELGAIQGQQTTPTRKQQAGTSGFEELLTETLATQENQTTAGIAAPAPPPAGLIANMLLGADSAQETKEDEEALLQDAFTQASGALDKWDSYAQSLKTPGGTLRDSYALLEEIDSTVSGLRQDTAALRDRSPAMDSLLNELEIMTLTEKIKFNRGDYLA
jgi:hypothetical protein